MSKLTLFILSLLTASNFALAADTREATLTKSLDRLRGIGFSSDFTKKVHDVMDRSTESSGEMYFSKGKMRIEQDKPEKNLLVYDGTVAWQEQIYDDGESKKVIVTKIKNVKASSAVLAALLSDEGILKNFKLLKPAKKSGKGRFELVPKNPKLSDVKKLRIDFVGDKLKSVAYLDSVENRVTFIFKRLKEETVSEKKFKYEPPKGAEVSEV